MFISRDKSGTYLLSIDKPERMAAHWKPPNNNYMVINKTFGEQLFPDVTWILGPIEINITIQDLMRK